MMRVAYTSHMDAYDIIKIVYNPNSTGPGKELADNLRTELAKRLPQHVVEVLPTARPGHGEALAYESAMAHRSTLVVSASGDGGYNDVINGLMRANDEGARVVAGLLPAGNANDHHRELSNDQLVRDIVEHKTQKVDLLRLDAVVAGRPFARYAHSYIGLGLTPKVGRELNKTDLNRINEILIVLKTVWRLRPVRISIDGQERLFDSVLCSNIGKVSKVFTVSDAGDSNDGQFEVTEIRHRSKVRLMRMLLSAATTGLEDTRQVKRYAFRTTHPTLVQLDGEVFTLDAGTDATIAIRPHALECII